MKSLGGEGISMKFALIDLFAAPGGLSLGFEMAGFRSLAAVDVDSRGMKTYSYNFPDSEAITGDIRELDTRELMKRIRISRGDVDVVVGGPPCQGFSTIGRVKIASLVRKGVWNLKNSHPRFIDDPRNILYREFVRIVRDLEPAVFVMENVPGITSYRDGEIVRQISEDFKEIGYRTEARVLNAVLMGVPQIRKRMFFIGTCLKDSPILWPQPTHREPANTSISPDHIMKPRYKLKPPCTVWEAIGDLPNPVTGKSRLSDARLEYDMEPFADYQRWVREGSSAVHNHIARQHSKRDVKVFSLLKEGGRWRDLPPEIRKLYGYRDDIFHDKMKKLKKDSPSWIVAAHLWRDGYMYIHPEQPRSITVREAARLQSFPDRFIFQGSRTDQFRQVGNAVPPLLAKAVAAVVMEILKAA